MIEPDSREPAVWSALRTVIDPELWLDVVTLGLIRDALMQVDGIAHVDRKLVWDPAWHAGMIARDAWT